MTTTQTDAIMALADRYAFHIPGSQYSDEARDALLAALQEQAREGEAVAKVVLTKTLGLPTMQWLGLDKQFDLADGQLLYTTPQPAQPKMVTPYITQEQFDRVFPESPQPARPVAQPLTDDQINLMVHSQHFDPSYKLKASDMVCLNWYKLGLRDGERAHGIGGGR